MGDEMNLRTWVLLLSFVAGMGHAHAIPRTWIAPHVSFEGALDQGRFGEEVGCSLPALGANGRSIVAVGAPFANGGVGAVYLYDPSDAGVPFQTFGPSAADQALQFGSAVEFIDDVNGDGVDDIVVGAPGTSAQVDGKLYAFVSVRQDRALRFVQCAILSSARGFAEKIQAIRAVGGDSDVDFVVGVPSESRIVGYKLNVQSDGSCTFAQGSSFLGAGEAAGRYGEGLGQVKSFSAQNSNPAALAVVAPLQGSFGSVSIFEATSSAMGGLSSTEISVSVPPVLSGTSIGTHYSSELFAVGNPADQGGRGVVSIYSASSIIDGQICSKARELSEPSSAFGRVVSHLGVSFAGLVGEGRTAFAVTQSEQATGGALAVFGVAQEGICGDLMELNNCRSDPYQEQGSALAGGDYCQTELNGEARRFVVVGSPGWSGGRGRVDIYLEGAERESAVECQTETPSAVSLSGTMLGEATATSPATPSSSAPSMPSPQDPASISTPLASAVTSTPQSSLTQAPPLDEKNTEGVPVTVPPTQTTQSSATQTPVANPSAGTQSEPPKPAPTSMYTPSPAPTDVGDAPTPGTSPQTPVSTATSTPAVEPTEGLGSDPTPEPTSSPAPTQENGEDGGEVTEPTPQYSPTATSTTALGNDHGWWSVNGGPSIPVFPGAVGLPTPEVTENGSQVQISMPIVRPELSVSARQKAVKTLMKKGRLSKKRAEAVLADPKNLVVTYIVTYSEVIQRSSFSLIQSAHADDRPRKRSTKITRIRSRSNNVTLARLQPGATYRVSYQVEISVRKPRAVLGVTRASGVSQFVYRGD